MSSIHIATLNINGMTSQTKIVMLETFVRAWDIDILLVQEVTQHVLHDIRGYTTRYNIGANGRGTAIIAKEGIVLENVTCIPPGRAIAARFNKCWIVNVYAPSGTARRHEREMFYNSELPQLLIDTSRQILMAGDFNSTLQQRDTTGALNYSRALSDLKGMELKHARNSTEERPGYTHYAPNGASRLYRIYLTKELYAQNGG